MFFLKKLLHGHGVSLCSYGNPGKQRQSAQVLSRLNHKILKCVLDASYYQSKQGRESGPVSLPSSSSAHLPVGVQTAKCPPFVILGSTAIHSRIRDNCFQSFLRHIVRTESLFSPFPDKAESYNHLKLLSEAYKMPQAWYV